MSRLPIVTSADRAELAELAVGPDLVVDGPLTLADLWDRQVARTRNSIALVEGDRRWTYGELDAHAREIGDRMLAGRLLTRIGGGRVPRAIRRRDRQPACDRHARRGLGRARPGLLRSGSSTTSWATAAHRWWSPRHGMPTGSPARPPSSTSTRRGGSSRAAAIRAMRPHAHDIACLIYTSGSTGQPEGRHGRASWHPQPAGLDVGGVPVRGGRGARAEDGAELRRQHLGNVRAAAGWRSCRGADRRHGATIHAPSSTPSPTTVSPGCWSCRRCCGHCSTAVARSASNSPSSSAGSRAARSSRPLSSSGSASSCLAASWSTSTDHPRSPAT